MTTQPPNHTTREAALQLLRHHVDALGEIEPDDVFIVLGEYFKRAAVHHSNPSTTGYTPAQAAAYGQLLTDVARQLIEVEWYHHLNEERIFRQ